MRIIPIQIDKFSIIIFFGFIGISLLPFADKIKVGSFLEFERLKEKITEIEVNQFLGEVLYYESDNEYYYYDPNGLHKIPDDKTRDFLKSPKGILPIKRAEFKKLTKASVLESVKTATLIMDNEGTVFIILNGKKYYVNSWSQIFDWGYEKNDVKEMTLDEIKKYPSGK